MTIEQPKVTRGKVQRAKLVQSSPLAAGQERRTGMPTKAVSPEEQLTTSAEAADALGGADRHQNQDLPVDLVREGANMLELQMRQSMCVTPLSMSSKAAQVVLRQF
ncbi:MAG TPA: hypothetical protein VIK40_04315 [Geomonas sp.]